MPGSIRIFVFRFSTFPSFIFSVPTLADPETNLTTDFTDTISIKDKSLIPGFPIFYFPNFIFSAIAPILNLNFMPTFWVRSAQERRTSARRRPADGPRDASPATAKAGRLVP